MPEHSGVQPLPQPRILARDWQLLTEPLGEVIDGGDCGCYLSAAHAVLGEKRRQLAFNQRTCTRELRDGCLDMNLRHFLQGRSRIGKEARDLPEATHGTCKAIAQRSEFTREQQMQGGTRIPGHRVPGLLT